MITSSLNPTIWVISDTHLIADSLHDAGAAFQKMQKTSKGKDLFYQETALSAFAKFANQEKPDAIVVTGDVTFNGEAISAKRFSEIFSDLQTTKLLVLPGNHDIFDGWARKFKANSQIITSQIGPNEWQSIFQESYGLAFSKDPNSLAYSVKLNPEYLLLMLDSNYYGLSESNVAPYTKGIIKHQEMLWLNEQLENATQHHIKPIIFMHHNLYAHNPVVNHNFVLDNAWELRELFKKYNVKLAFSGHIHAQNIVLPNENCPTLEITTSSFSTTDQGYGILNFSSRELDYKRKSFNMTPYLTEKEKSNYTLLHFHDYLHNILLANVATSFFKQKKADMQTLRKIGRLFAQMNYNFFTGHNHIDAADLKQLLKSNTYQTLIDLYPEFESYLSTLYDTSNHSNLKARIIF